HTSYSVIYTFHLITFISYLSFDNINISLSYFDFIFQWTPYEDLAIQAEIPVEFLQNPNIWLVRVPLVNYTTVEMYYRTIVIHLTS
ncbi:hypothetical protein J1N35_045846, partial [Gossypium stocksii]